MANITSTGSRNFWPRVACGNDHGAPQYLQSQYQQSQYLQSRYL
jgi:hypothetical protein